MSLFSRIATALLVFLLAFSTGCVGREKSKPVPVVTASGTRVERTLISGGIERRYIAHIPSFSSGNRHFPVVLAFHGGGGNMVNLEKHSNLHTAQQASRFVVVYPDGYERTWNVGGCCGGAYRDRIDDIQFVRDLLKDLASVVRIDENRIFATGFSNGAMLSYRLACDLPNRIAAIAPIGGTMRIEHAECKPSRPVPIFHIHGLSDVWAPFGGGVGKVKKAGYNPAVYPTVQFWSSANGCAIKRVKTKRLAGAVCYYHPRCGNEAEVVLCTVDKLDHQWPGDNPGYRYRKIFGQPAPDVPANSAILKFFLSHPLSGNTSADH